MPRDRLHSDSAFRRHFWSQCPRFVQCYLHYMIGSCLIQDATRDLLRSSHDLQNTEDMSCHESRGILWYLLYLALRVDP